MCCLRAETRERTDGRTAGAAKQLLMDGEPQPVKVGENFAFVHSRVAKDARNAHKYKPSHPPPSNHGSLHLVQSHDTSCVTASDPSHCTQPNARSLLIASAGHLCEGFLQRVAAAGWPISIQAVAAAPPPLPHHRHHFPLNPRYEF